MSSRETVLGYIDQMIALERKMEARYRELAEKVDDPGYKAELLRLASDESDHAALLWDLTVELGK